MKQRVHINSVLVCVLIAVVILPLVLSAQPVRAGGGIVLRPPFDGTYRVTAYFDHDEPSYAYGPPDGYNWIYTGERVTSSYSNKTGEPYPYDGHDGWDWSMGEWTDVLAAAAGEVVVSEDDWGTGGYGHVIIIAHESGYYTMYAHLRQRLVQVGDPVTAGQHIAESGASGGVAAHLHFGVRHGGYGSTANAIDPFGWRGSGRDPLFDYNSKESSCLWSGVPGDAISCADIIVEDDGAGWSQHPTADNTCSPSPMTSWARCDSGNGFRQHWSYVWDPADFYVSWRPWDNQVRYPGYYQIHAFIPAVNGTTASAQYQVHHDVRNLTTVSVNQLQVSDDWVFLGQYRLWQQIDYVSLYDYTGEISGSRRIAADAIKFSASIVHLPDVRNSGGWTSSIVIRNNSGSSAQVAINYYNSSGGGVSDQTTTIAGNGSKTKTPPSAFSGSAVVVASQDVSVVVENLYSYGGRYLAAAHPGEMAPAATVYAPYVVQKWFSGHSSWRQTTDLIIQNTGSQEATVSVTFYDSWGSYGGSHEVTRNNIPANGQVTVSGTEMPDDWESWWGVSLASAVIQSTQPVAVVARTYTGVANSSGVIVTPYLVGSHRAFASGADEVYMPVAAAEYYNYDSSLQVQDIGGSGATFDIEYYRSDGTLALDLEDQTVGAYRSMNFWRPSTLPANYLGSAVVEVTSGGPVAAMAQYDTFDTSQNRYGVNQYEGVTAGTRSDVLPHVQGTSPWDWTGIMAQNMGGSTTNITLQFYYQSGSPVDPAVTKNNVNPKAAALYWGTSMPDISGSAVASSDPAMPVALVVNFDRSESWTNKDRMMGYGAVK